MIDLLSKTSHAVNRATEFVLVPIVAVFTLLVVLAVVSRYAFNLPFVTSVELTRIAFLWACFLGAAAGVKRMAHIRVTFLIAWLPPGLQIAGYIVTFASFLIFSSLMVWYGSVLTERMSVTYFPTLQVSQAWLYAALPVSGALIVLHSLAGLIEVATGRFAPPPSPMDAR
jgi:TRAP-type C4-dicarboxylate transport system permease small subunit